MHLYAGSATKKPTLATDRPSEGVTHGHLNQLERNREVKKAADVADAENTDANDRDVGRHSSSSSEDDGHEVVVISSSSSETENEEINGCRSYLLWFCPNTSPTNL
ncbi:hypothetical protein G7054_g8461 [Neopestalotiopsis clavispora]|nr:hypothetical protein G7054_g8461 [Neopestalotiopsis clavispora]